MSRFRCQMNFDLPGHVPAAWEFLRPAARDLGFVAIGLAPAAPVAKDATARYIDWITNGHSATLAYLSKHMDLRFDPTHPLILQDATAIVVTAFPYGQGGQQQGIWKWVAAHARARDYHRTIKKRLKKLAVLISDRFPSSSARVFVDSAPVMERTWALSAGIGTLGKNGALMVPFIGPRVLLGEIVCTSVPGPPQPPPTPTAFQLCGECSLCIDNCPTGALFAPATVDCRRCLSYWTIEHPQGFLPRRSPHGPISCSDATFAPPFAPMIDQRCPPCWSLPPRHWGQTYPLNLSFNWRSAKSTRLLPEHPFFEQAPGQSCATLEH